MAEEHSSQALGPNEWLVDEMYEQYRTDPSSVSQSWQEFFADYRRDDQPAPAPPAPPADAEPTASAAPAPVEEQTATAPPPPGPKVVAPAAKPAVEPEADV